MRNKKINNFNDNTLLYSTLLSLYSFAILIYHRRKNKKTKQTKMKMNFFFCRFVFYFFLLYFLFFSPFAESFKHKEQNSTCNSKNYNSLREKKKK